jgi:hypothetical protein
MKKLLLIIVLWLLTMNSNGQEHSGRNTISFNFGSGYIVRQDLIFSPVTHKDFSFLNLGFEYQRDAFYHQKLKVGFATFTPGITVPFEFSEHGESKTASPHYFTLFDLDYLIGKSISKNENPVILGLLFSTDIQLLDYVYARIGNFGYFSSIGLGGFVKKEFRISDKSSVSGKLQMPLINWLARSPYLVNDDEFIENISFHSDFKSFWEFLKDGKWNTLNHLQIFNLEFKYHYEINHRWGIGAGYSFEFTHAVNPRNLLSFRNWFNLSVNLKF